MSNVFLGKKKSILKLSLKANTMMPASQDWIGCIHLLQFMKMMHTFTRGWESGELSSLLTQLDKSFKISEDLKTVSTFEKTDVKLFWAIFDLPSS